MYRLGPQRIRSLVLATGAFLGAVSVNVPAQLAPVAGAHYAARPSDTEFAGTVASGGDYGAAVPLDFSPIDGALPVPLQVVHSGKSLGAAGLGWDVPVSYVFHNTTLAHRRPETNSAGVIGHEQWSMTLLGERIDLVRNSADTAWIAQHGHPQLEIRQTSSEILTVYDG